MTTIYSAKKIITMNPARPSVSHVAVRDGRILGAGSLQELTGFGDYTLDERFADKVLMPGMIEGHCHAVEGKWWRYVYCGFHERMDPHGTVWSGLSSIDEVIARMREKERTLDDPAAALTGWAIDPIYYSNKKITRQDLDRVSTTRPVGIMHASGHIMNVNSKALELADYLRPGIEHDGVPLGDDGLPTGELKGPDVMFPAGRKAGFDDNMLEFDEPGLIDFSRLCVRTGVTTATDLAAQLGEDTVAMGTRVTGAEDFPVRIMSLRFHHGVTPKELIEHVVSLKQQSTDRFRLGKIKVIADGSIQGFSARLNWPGYYNGAPNGLWYIAPEQMLAIYEMALQEDIQIHTHTNGDEATDLVLDTLEAALKKYPDNNHRFTIQHGQLINAAQYRRMAKLNMCVNHFANHHFYWGDEHYQLTVGPERAERMNACRTALDNGIPLAIHSDAPVTPLSPLFTAWCAVNRLTNSGRTQGEYEKITVAEALYAITLGAAYTLDLDNEIGSIEAGKHADFAILEEDPTTVPALNLKDITVWGTVQGGRIFSANDM
ncbi:MAG: amidohydrolase [Granulosicoccus sp.]